MARGLRLLGALALGQVARGGDHHRAAARREQPARHLDREGAAVLAPVGADAGLARAGRRGERAVVLEQLLARAVQAHALRVHAEQLLARVAELLAHAFVEIDEALPADVDEQHHVGGRIERGAEAPQRRLGVLAALQPLADREAQPLRGLRRGPRAGAGQQDGRYEIHAAESSRRCLRSTGP